MKKILSLFILMILLVSCTSSSDIKKADDIDKFLKGNHKLRKFTRNEDIIKTPASASYFLFTASYTGAGEEKIQYIQYSWLANNGEYIISKTLVDDVRVMFHKGLKEPYITFRYDNESILKSVESSYDGYKYNPDNIKYVISEEVTSITVHCAEEDYPSNINISQLE